MDISSAVLADTILRIFVKYGFSFLSCLRCHAEATGSEQRDDLRKYIGFFRASQTAENLHQLVCGHPLLPAKSSCSAFSLISLAL